MPLRVPAEPAANGRFFEALIERAALLPPVKMGIVHPCDGVSVEAALAARDRGLIIPILIGPRAKIEAAARDAGLSLAGVEIVDAPHSHAAAEKAVALARHCKLDALKKGSLHTDELMAAVVNKDHGLRTDRRMSHVFVLDVKGHDKPLLVTDAAINIAPTLDEKRDIVRNAIDLAHALGNARPEGGGAVRRRKCRSQDSFDHRRGGAVQNGGSRPDYRRRSRWPLGLRQRHFAASRRRQGHCFPGRRRRRYSGGAEPRRRQHPGQAIGVSGGGGDRRPGARGARADRADQPRRRREGAGRLDRAGADFRALARRARRNAGESRLLEKWTEFFEENKA